jgi:uncharacterized membrane protein
MRNRLNCNIIVVLIGFLLYSCNSSSDTKKIKNSNPYFPVSEGNNWEYINEAPREESEIYTVTMQNINEDKGTLYFDLSSFPFFSKENKKVTIAINKDGSISTEPYRDNLNTFIPATVNLNNGYSWNYGQWSASVNFLNDTVKTENGTYTNCMFLNFAVSITFSAEIWLVKDVGIVKWGYNRTNPPTLRPIYYVLKKIDIK